MNLARVISFVVAIFVFCWWLTRRDYWQIMRSHSITVLADIDRLQVLIERETSLILGLSVEASLILRRWSDIRWGTDSRDFQIPPEFEGQHDQWWNPVRQYMAEVAECTHRNDKEQITAKLTELKVRVTGFRRALQL